MQVALLFDAAKMPEKRKCGEATAALKIPQDYLKRIVAKEPDRVKGIWAREEFAPLKISTLRAARDTWLASVRPWV